MTGREGFPPPCSAVCGMCSWHFGAFLCSHNTPSDTSTLCSPRDDACAQYGVFNSLLLLLRSASSQVPLSSSPSSVQKVLLPSLPLVLANMNVVCVCVCAFPDTSFPPFFTLLRCCTQWCLLKGSVQIFLSIFWSGILKTDYLTANLATELTTHCTFTP